MKLIMIVYTIAIASLIQMSSAGMVGGWSTADVNSADVQKVVVFAVEKLSAESNFDYTVKPIEVVEAKRQVVSGMNYQITLRAGETECAKNSSDDECAIQSCGHVITCSVRVWYQAWKTVPMEMTNHSCQEEPLPSSCSSYYHTKHENVL